MRILPWPLAAILLAALSAPAMAANLDLSASYRLRGLSYKNLNLNTEDGNNHSFLSNDARFEIGARGIHLETVRDEDMTMDVGVGIHALGVAGSTTVYSRPFDRVADHYPNAQFIPFIEKAFVEVHNLFGYPVDGTFGRQNFKLASGLLLDDDGAGVTGVSLRAKLPFWGMRSEAFAFSAKEALAGPNSLGLYGVTFVLPGQGTWQASQLVENDQRNQRVFGCIYDGITIAERCRISKARRSFSSIRYQISYGPLVFEGEAAMQKGVGTPTGAAPSPSHITYNGDAQVVRAKWKQRLYKTGEGIARLVVARGSGDNPATSTTDEAFFPSNGHRFKGLERDGFGDLFGATPYDAFGGNYSSTTVSGLREGVSGLITAGAGYTFPSYKGFTLDIDYFLFQADRLVAGKRTLGGEWDFKLRYVIRDRFTLAASAALFGVGTASNRDLGQARKFALEAFGKF